MAVDHGALGFGRWSRRAVALCLHGARETPQGVVKQLRPGTVLRHGGHGHDAAGIVRATRGHKGRQGLVLALQLRPPELGPSQKDQPDAPCRAPEQGAGEALGQILHGADAAFRIVHHDQQAMIRRLARVPVGPFDHLVEGAGQVLGAPVPRGLRVPLPGRAHIIQESRRPPRLAQAPGQLDHQAGLAAAARAVDQAGPNGFSVPGAPRRHIVEYARFIPVGNDLIGRAQQHGRADEGRVVRQGEALGAEHLGAMAVHVRLGLGQVQERALAARRPVHIAQDALQLIDPCHMVDVEGRGQFAAHIETGQADMDELAGAARLFRLRLHPAGGDGRVGPDHQHHIGGLKGLIDLGDIAVPRFERLVPPDAGAGPLQRRDQAGRLLARR